MPEPEQRVQTPGNAYKPAVATSTLSMSSILVLSFGSLILVTVLVVLGLAVQSGLHNTYELLRDKADLGIGVITSEIDSHLKAARDQAGFVARTLETGQVSTRNTVRLQDLLFGAMAADPAISAIAFFDPDGMAVIADRSDDPARSYPGDFAGDPDVIDTLDYGRRYIDPAWGEPLYRTDMGQTILTLTWPVWADGEFRGVLVTIFEIRVFSEFLDRAVRDLGPDVFVLFGKDEVLAHSLMADGYQGLSVKQPLPRLAGYEDAVLSRMWDPEVSTPNLQAVRPPLESRMTVVDGVEYVFIYRRLDSYTSTPWYAGAYFATSAVSGELDRLSDSIVAGLAALLIAMMIAYLIGHALAGPVRRISAAARLVSELRLEEIRDLPCSRVRELDEQSSAFNAMAGALRWFQAYVPRTLVHQLVREGELAGLASSRRNVTVMFTDMVGYSTVSEGLSAIEIAGLLNHHFAILIGAIEAEDGTIDKFMGDSVMALWGAPEKQKNRAVRACRAALAIRRRIAADNRERKQRDEPPIKIRIGIHSGTAVAGNIGTNDRMNYTVIGDDVNVAQRLEQLGKDVSPCDEVTIVISAATAADLDDCFETEPVGEVEIKGRTHPVAVYRLVGQGNEVGG